MTNANDPRFYPLAVLYARCVDQRDYSALDKVFTADATLEVVFGAGQPAAHRFEGLPAIASGLAIVEAYDRTWHSVGQQWVVEESDDSASTETYCQAVHSWQRSGEPELFTMYVRYCDELCRGDDGWRIQRRQVISEFTSGEPNI